ncbi:MAG: chorismate synthase [Flavobacteriales bacterium]|nr:chorismate synthase [Flavobacteriales bacterium]
MAGNSFGTLFKLTSYGESHGVSIGGIIEGCPAGLKIDFDFIQLQLDRRKPGQSNITTQRKETDQVVFLSGIFEGKTTGTPIAFQIINEDHKSKDYSHIQDKYRPSHADYVYQEKYGNRDYRGGGRSSARETACRVVAGAIAQLLLKLEGVEIHSYVQQVGKIVIEQPYQELDLSQVFANKVRCPDELMAQKMIAEIEQVKKEGDTIGGVVQGMAFNVPVGLGDPVFDKLHADLAKAMLSINAVKGFEYGSGFNASSMRGSEHNDAFIIKEGKVRTESNFSGGIQGGISNGETIYFRVAFKPVATLIQDQKSINKKGEEVVIEGKGRHDPCVVPRAVPIVTAMTALVLADHFLRNKISTIS